MSAVEKFPILLSDAEEESSAVPPCFSHEGINVRLSSFPCCVLRVLADPALSPAFVPRNLCLLYFQPDFFRNESLEGWTLETD